MLGGEHRVDVDGCIGYLAHPFKKDGLGLPEFSFPLARNLIEGQENLFISQPGRG